MKTTTDIQEVQQALSNQQAVQTFLGGNNVNVNALSVTEAGEVLAKWSHRDYPESHLDTLEPGTTFEIFADGETPRRR